MNDQIYQWGIRGIQALQGIPMLAQPLTAVSRIWLRHQKISQFLAWGGFDTVVDGGANVGEFASSVRAVLPNAQLLCVEPHAPSASLLRKQGFTVIEAALWHEKTRLNLSQPTTATTSCTVMAAADQGNIGSWEVETFRLDDLPVDGRNVFIKLDLQGAEIPALRGMDGLWARTNAIQLEVSIGDTGTYRELSRMLEDEGFNEYSTPNELSQGNQVVEADKIWLRRGFQPR